tara:strand:+ start:329 stop:697 length:369 start_codon:yes stop_codon:yes gene_type:complete
MTLNMYWTVDSTRTQDVDLRIIQGHYPWAVKTQLGEHIALVKSQSKAKTGFAKASEVGERDEGFEIAELISAAPEMYEAIEWLLNSYEENLQRQLKLGLKYGSPSVQAIENARKALRKAKPQ